MKGMKSVPVLITEKMVHEAADMGGFVVTTPSKFVNNSLPAIREKLVFVLLDIMQDAALDGDLGVVDANEYV